MPTRDSWLWTVLFAAGLTMAVGLTAGKAEDYGLGPVAFKWLQLAATGLVAAGKLGNSPLKGEDDTKIAPRDFY